VPVEYVFALVMLLLSGITLFRLYRLRVKSRFQAFMFLGASIPAAFFLYAVAPWSYLSYYLKYVLAGLYIIGLLLVIPRIIRAQAFSETIKTPWLVGRILLMLIAITLVLYWVAGYTYIASDAVNLKFPFHTDKKYYVMQGGASRLTNPAHRNFSKQLYGYAMDVAALYPLGNRANGIHPKDLNNYAIYGDTLFSPCDGVVIQMVDSIVENTPGTYFIKLVHGNHVIIQNKDYRLFMAHFIRKSVTVKIGDTVSLGQPIARVGNAGFSAEPHLHINVLKGYKKSNLLEKLSKLPIGKRFTDLPEWQFEYPYDGNSVPFLFDGEFYSINDIMQRKN